MKFNQLYRRLLREQQQSRLTPVIVYPGRFQPMLPHHAKVYQTLKELYQNAEVYIGTSDKVEPGKSPFNFAEKVKIITTLYDIPSNNILAVKSPYNGDQYLEHIDGETHYLMIAVGEKDMQENPRFAFRNIDPETGLEMKKRVPEPTYIQPEQAMGHDPAPMTEHAYLITAPTVKSDGEVASASTFREAIRSAQDPHAYLRSIFDDKVNPVADLIISKILQG